eukprot:5417830-Amphidinium_carterae.2
MEDGKDPRSMQRYTTTVSLLTTRHAFPQHGCCIRMRSWPMWRGDGPDAHHKRAISLRATRAKGKQKSSKGGYSAATR